MCGIIVFIFYNDFYNKDSINIPACVAALYTLQPRGPDHVKYTIVTLETCTIFIGFARLAIMDTSDCGMQPFEMNDSIVVCNGEIYNHHALKEQYKIDTKSGSDCEILLPLYYSKGEKSSHVSLITDQIDAEFALVLIDKTKKVAYAARDRYGVRPLFFGIGKGVVGFASEMKALTSLKAVKQVPPKKGVYVRLDDHTDTSIFPLYEYTFTKKVDNLQESLYNGLIDAVKKRLDADRPIGFLLSGGLDSSLIVSIASRLLGPEKIVCFTIGLPDSSDVIASKKVTEFLGVKHHIVPFDIDKAIDTIPEVIRVLETCDITTVRASTPQYIMAKYIQENTDIRVILSGEGSDEIHGSYKYFRNAPNGNEFRKETVVLLTELHKYDNLRTDRTMSGSGLEVRVPFLDYNYVETVMSSDPELWMSKDVIEKKPLRDAFKGFLPDELLYRSKEAFSDAVSSEQVCWYKTIQSRIEKLISDEKFANHGIIYKPPISKEALYYRMCYDQFYPDQKLCIYDYWMPKFQNKPINDPSATVL